MLRLTSTFPFLLIAFLLCRTSVAAITVSFQQCIDLVKRNNADLILSEQNFKASTMQVNSLKGNYFPQLNGNLSYLQSGPENYSATLTATQNLFNGYLDSAKIDRAQAESLIIQQTLQITKASVSFELKSAFANLLYAKESLQITEEFKNRRQQNSHLVQLRFNSGRENKGSLLLSQAYLEQANLDIFRAQNTFENSQVDLKKLIGMDEESQLSITGELPLREPPLTDPDFKSLIALIPSYRQSQFQINSSQASLTIAKSGYFPTLNLLGSVGKSDDSFFPTNDTWSVSAVLSIPLFNGGRDYYSLRSSMASLLAAENNSISIYRQLHSSLTQAYSRYKEAVADLKVNYAFLQAAKSRAEIARSKYNNGLLTFDEWDIIENDLIVKTKSYLQSKRERIIAESAWEQAQGTGVIP